MINHEILPLFTELIIYGILIRMAYEDFRYRGISWYWLVLLFILTAYFFYRETILIDTAINLLLMSFQLAMVTLYFSIKHKQPVNITRHYLGWGDILFLAIIALIFNPLCFICFYVFTLVAVLLSVVLYRWITKKAEASIPLAGMQAILLAGYMVTATHFPDLLKTFSFPF